MNFATFAISSFLVAILCVAFVSSGPEAMIVNAIIVWAIPVMIAAVLRNKETLADRYLWPTILLVIMIALIVTGLS